jgi:formylglycine-generating enzyme required for sulfatase activity
MKYNPSRFNQCLDCPVENISFQDALRFVDSLNSLTGKTFRLPMEAEWEYVAKGGTNPSNTAFSGSESIDDIGWYAMNSGQTTHPVGQKKPNTLGLYDINGNVAEWCMAIGKVDPKVLKRPEPKGALRGGDWQSDAKDCKIESRVKQEIAQLLQIKGGLRLAMNVEN